MQISKKTVLVSSALLSVVLHGVLLGMAPRIPMLHPYDVSNLTKPNFQVRLVEERRVPEETSPADRSGLVSRPSSVRDLLKREADVTTPGDSLLNPVADMAMLQRRLAMERVTQEKDITPDETVLREIDTKLVEISQQEMRSNLEIVRRLVAPSTTRIIDEGENPVFRGDNDLEQEEVLVFSQQIAASFEPVRVPVSAPPERREPIESVSQDTPLSPLDTNEAPPNLLQLEQERVRSPLAGTSSRDSGKYDFLDDMVNVTLEKYIPKNEPYGYFRLCIAPKTDATLQILPKDITFVIDASSSITQRKLDNTLAAVRSALQQLRPEDRFNLIIFRDNPSLFQPAPVPATPENKTAATNFLKNIQSRGQTNIYEGIRPVMDMPRRPGIPSIVVISSDGRPTTGMVDARNVINALTEENRFQNSIFAFGGGSTVNRYLLDLLAYRNKGESYVAPSIEKMTNDFQKFLQRLSDPILVDCSIDFGRLNAEDVFPKEIPDFYRGQAVTIYGRFDPKKDREFAIRLVGKAGDRQKEVVFREDLTRAGSGDDRIARTWAFRRIYHLIGEMCRYGETPERLDEIRTLSRKFNIRTVYD
ncbi:MAG TPA: VWA domain-containing protein [Candidatus Hydrogenedentes bacterium]|nr:VWA domain-containing protein [Candidatus Hydrogenedentota bacterium]HOL75924.1 VWA domain-containing protein [Candidatus Hydrogenedentota bacterium]